jgi:hypothetical protein
MGFSPLLPPSTKKPNHAPKQKPNLFSRHFN